MPSRKPQLNVRVPESTLAAVNLLCREWQCSQSALVCALVGEGVDAFSRGLVPNDLPDPEPEAHGSSPGGLRAC